MKLATREQIKTIDKIAREDFGLSSEALIKKAGAALAAKFAAVAAEFGVEKDQRIGIWCGPGNNGADGKVMGSLLTAQNYSQVKLVESTHWSVQDFDVIIDAFFGVGLNRAPSAQVQKKIQEIHRSSVKVFAVDIPTGLDANTGEILGAAVKATATLTLYPPKPGLFLSSGPQTSGKVFSTSLGLPSDLLGRRGLLDTFLVDRKFARSLLPLRRPTANKTTFGHLLVIAGSEGMEGAAVMVSEAAARMGCGYVSICSLSAETKVRVRPDFLQLSEAEFFSSDLQKYQAVVVGPGLGRSQKAFTILQHLRKNHEKVLVDADALTVLADHPELHLPSGWILTPHAGELSRLTGISAKVLEQDRLQAVQAAESALGAAILFKGFRTVLRNGGLNYVIYAGNAALAKAGSGDTLAGFIGSLMAQGMATAEAGVLGAYIHGRIADDWIRQGHDARTLLASDLPELLDATLSRLKNNS